VDLLRRHLPNVFADAVGLQSIGKPNKKKVATHIRDEIETVVKHLQIAQERVASLDPLVVRFLDFELTSLNAGLAPSEDTPSVDVLTGELAERIMLLMTILERVKPGTKRAGEAGWAFTAVATAHLLRAATGQPLRRSYSKSKGADAYWSGVLPEVRRDGAGAGSREPAVEKLGDRRVFRCLARRLRSGEHRHLTDMVGFPSI
jgi:hypothetical protein